MKLRSLVFGAAIILIANAFALVHSALNRMGAPDAVITLTEREFYFYMSPSSDDDSGVTLHLDWAADTYNFATNRWLDRQKLEQLGFNSSMKAAKPTADEFYRRQRPRVAFVAVEYNGPAWRALQEDYEQNRAAREARHENTFPEQGPHDSHLVAIDADLNASSLRRRYPDGTSVLIVPALISVDADDKSPRGFRANIVQLESSVHVPRPFSDQFRHLKQPAPPYSVQLHFGTFHEPWVTAVEIP